MKKQQNKNFSIRYDKSEINYITQFLVSPGNEEVLLDLSSGLIDDTDPNEPKTLPIQTRVALPWSVTERLASILSQVVAKRNEQREAKMSVTPHRRATSNAPIVPQATLPQMSREQV